MNAYAQVRNQRTSQVAVTGTTQNNPAQTSQPATTSALFIIFLLVAVSWVVVSIILAYHWNRFGFKDKGVLLGQAIYFAVSLLLLMVALFSIT
jgi:hypothetical protein